MTRVLLDENVPRKLKWMLEADAVTVPERGWSGIKNGPLLRLASSEFDALVTIDRGIEYQHNLREIELCLIVLSVNSNDIDDILPLVPSINAALREAAPGRVIRVVTRHCTGRRPNELPRLRSRSTLLETADMPAAPVIAAVIRPGPQWRGSNAYGRRCQTK